MNVSRLIKHLILLVGLGLAIILGISLVLLNMPRRNVQSSEVDYNVKAEVLVKEYLEDPIEANQKYLSEDGDSKILIITGNIYSVEKNLNDETVVLLKTEGSKIGVRCVFTEEASQKNYDLKSMNQIILKGIIRSGAEYDRELDIYEDVLIEKCDVFSQ